MINFLTLSEFNFLRTAFLFTAAASLTFGLLGSFVVSRRIGYLAGAIAHCAFGGMGIGIWLKGSAAAGIYGFAALAELLRGNESSGEWLAALSSRINPVAVAVFVAVVSTVFIGFIQKYAKEREDALIGILWTAGMAVGLLFLDRTKGFVEVSAYLLGNVLLISPSDIRTILVLDALVASLCLLFFKRLEVVCFDEEFARIRGMRVDLYQGMLLFLIAITVVLSMRIVGIVLVIALLTIPASIASRLTKRLGYMAIFAVVISFLSCWAGLWLCYVLNFSAGPMIVILLSGIYMVVVLTSGKR